MSLASVSKLKMERTSASEILLFIYKIKNSYRSFITAL
jgi:hypothetical protein